MLLIHSRELIGECVGAVVPTSSFKSLPLLRAAGARGSVWASAECHLRLPPLSRPRSSVSNPRPRSISAASRADPRVTLAPATVDRREERPPDSRVIYHGILHSLCWPCRTPDFPATPRTYSATSTLLRCRPVGRISKQATSSPRRATAGPDLRVELRRPDKQETVSDLTKLQFLTTIRIIPLLS